MVLAAYVVKFVAAIPSMKTSTSPPSGLLKISKSSALAAQ